MRQAHQIGILRYAVQAHDDDSGRLGQLSTIEQTAHGGHLRHGPRGNCAGHARGGDAGGGDARGRRDGGHRHRSGLLRNGGSVEHAIADGGDEYGRRHKTSSHFTVDESGNRRPRRFFGRGGLGRQGSLSGGFRLFASALVFSFSDVLALARILGAAPLRLSRLQKRSGLGDALMRWVDAIGLLDPLGRA